MSGNIKSYLKGVGSGYAKTALMILVGLWMVPFSLNFLTQAEFGVFAIAGDIILWLGLLHIGTGASLNSRASQLIGKGDKKHLSSLSSTAFVLQVIMSVLTVVVGGFISLTVNGWFQVSDPIEGLSLVVFILALGASIRITSQVFNGLLIANKQIHIHNMLGIGMFLLRTILVIVFLMMGMKLMALALSSLISTVVISLFTYAQVRKHMPDVEFKLARFRKDHVKDLLGNGIWFTIGGVAAMLIANLDRFMVGHYVSLEAVAAFIITGKLYFIAEKVHDQIFNVMRPYFGQLHGQAKSEKLSELYHAAFSGSLLLSTLMASVIYLINEWFITWWVGPDFYLGSTISFLLALNFVLQSSGLPNRILSASALFKMPQQNGARIFEGGLNLVLTILLASKFGIEGVLLGSVIATALCSTVMLNLIARSYFDSSHSKWRSLWTYAALGSLMLVFLGNHLGSLSYLMAVVLFVLVAFTMMGGNGRKLYHQLTAMNSRP
jgi:O-antigen/teichoic acid export membrane protein